MRLVRALLPLSLFGSMLLGGCTMPGIVIETESLDYAPPGGALVLTEVEEPKRPLLRVVEVADQRPASQKVGSKPRAWYLLVANWRIGNYTTGDSDWGGDVPGQTTASLVDALKKTDYFEEVRVEPAAETYEGEGFVLEVKLDEFQARQRYRAYTYFIGYMETVEEIGAAKGLSKLSYRLIDPEFNNTTIHQNVAESMASEGKEAITEVGVRAMRETQTKLVNDVIATLDRY